VLIGKYYSFAKLSLHRIKNKRNPPLSIGRIPLKKQANKQTSRTYVIIRIIYVRLLFPTSKGQVPGRSNYVVARDTANSFPEEPFTSKGSSMSSTWETRRDVHSPTQSKLLLNFCFVDLLGTVEGKKAE
jgi:hypothetical protein